MKTKKIKRKIHRTKDPTWSTRTYSGLSASRNPFNIEWVKYYNPVEGRNQIMFIYSCKATGKIVKHRILR